MIGLFLGVEVFWSDYSCFEEEVNTTTERTMEDRKMLVKNYQAEVDDDHKLAKEEYEIVLLMQFLKQTINDWLMDRYTQRHFLWQYIKPDFLPTYQLDKSGQRQMEFWLKIIQ